MRFRRSNGEESPRHDKVDSFSHATNKGPKRLVARRSRVDERLGHELMSAIHSDSSGDSLVATAGLGNRLRLAARAGSPTVGQVQRVAGSKRWFGRACPEAAVARRTTRRLGGVASAAEVLNWPGTHDTKTRAALENMVSTLERLPQNSKYVQHKLRCAWKALELIGSDRNRGEGDEDAELASLLETLQIKCSGGQFDWHASAECR